MEDDFEELLEAKPEKSAATGSSFTATITRGSIAALLAQGVKPPAIARALGMTQKEVLAAIRRNKLEAVDDVKIVASPQKIAANREACGAFIERSLALATGLVPRIGYDRAAAVAKTAYDSGRTIREVLTAEAILPKEEIDQLLDI